MTWQRSFKWIAAVELLVLVGLYALLPALGVKTERRTLAGVRSRFPVGAAEPLDLNGWKGVRLPPRFRLFWKDFADAAASFRELNEKSLRNVHRKIPLSLFDGGVYAVRRRPPKGYELTCAFRIGGRVCWLDMVSTSTIDFYRRAFDECIVNLEIGGRSAAPVVRQQVAAMSRSVSPWVIPSHRELLFMLTGFFVVLGGGMFMVMRLAGSLPRGRNPEIDFCSPQATLIERRLGRRSTPCCLCLGDQELVVYRFRRPYLRIPLGREKGELRLLKKSLHYERYQIILGEEELQRWRMRLGL